MAIEPTGTGERGIEGPDSGPFSAADFLGGAAAGTDASGSGDEFDSAIHIGRDKRNADGSFRKKRGRRPGNSSHSGNQRRSRNQASIDQLSKILLVVHTGLAATTRTPEMALDQTEADSLANATAAVLDEFNITPDPKLQAIVGFVTVASMIYGPRIYMIRQRKKTEQEKEE